MLDGYEVSMEKIYDLDIERIETYTILKDAAATAMYGSRAANGVVVITTKPLPAGRLNVTYSGNFTINAPDLSSYNLMNAREARSRTAGRLLRHGRSVADRHEAQRVQRQVAEHRARHRDRLARAAAARRSGTSTRSASPAPPTPSATDST